MFHQCPHFYIWLATQETTGIFMLYDHPYRCDRQRCCSRGVHFGDAYSCILERKSPLLNVLPLASFLSCNASSWEPIALKISVLKFASRFPNSILVTPLELEVFPFRFLL